MLCLNYTRKAFRRRLKPLDVLAIRESKIQKDKKKPQGAKDNDKGKTKLAYTPNPKISPPPKREVRQRTLSATTARRLNKDDTKSQSRYVFVCLMVEPWTGRSKQQLLICLLQKKKQKKEARVYHVTVAEASMEAVWMRKFIDGLGDVMPSNKSPIEILCDNAPAITIANDPGIMKGGRH
ncbi:hypothetical protein Tco_0404308 [Tanacetum coccineum]